MKTIILVTTPIGNIEDMTVRAVNTLKNAQIILAEDTRETKKLLEMLGVDYSGIKIYSFNDHDQAKIPSLIQSIVSDEIVLVSDAGSPVISDPAFPLIRYILEQGGQVRSVPGVSAVTTALELSGMPPLPFSFHGFLGRKKGEIIAKIESVKTFGGLHLFFEGPSRILDTLEIIAESFPEADICVAREMTKKFESVYRFKARDFKSIEILAKGEFVLCIYFEKTQSNTASSQAISFAQNYLQKKSTKNLAKVLASVLGLPTEEVYNQLVD